MGNTQNKGSLLPVYVPDYSLSGGGTSKHDRVNIKKKSTPYLQDHMHLYNNFRAKLNFTLTFTYSQLRHAAR